MVLELYRAQKVDVENDVTGVDILSGPIRFGHDGLRGAVHDVGHAGQWALLEQGGVPADRIRFASALGHAFDYYDGLSFEVRSEALDPERAVAVGGRYDGLPARLGGAAGARAVGCMVRPWRAWAGGEA